MKRFIGAAILLTLSLGWTTPSAAQQGRVGVFGGLNLANLSGNDIDGTSMLLGGFGGAVGAYSLSSIVSVGAFGFVSMQGAEISSGEKLKINSVNFAPYVGITPPMSGVLPVQPVFYAGPELGIHISCDQAGTDCLDTLEQTSFGILFGATLIIQNQLMVGAGYTFGGSAIGESGDDVKHQVIRVYVGLTFPLGVPVL